MDDPVRKKVPTDLSARLVRAWEPVFREFPTVVAAYLYGSAAEGQPARDLDVGIVVGATPLPLALRGSLARRLADTSPIDLPIDLRELDEEDAVFDMEVLRRGMRLYEANRDDRAMFEATVFSRYQDIAPEVEKLRQAMAQRLLT